MNTNLSTDNLKKFFLTIFIISTLSTASTTSPNDGMHFIRHKSPEEANSRENEKYFNNSEPIKSLSLTHIEAAIAAKKTDISFGIADIKYDGNQLKILEFGEGTRSMFEGFDRIFGIGSMWKKIWDFLYKKSSLLNDLEKKTHPELYFVDHAAITPEQRRSIGYSQLAIHKGHAYQSLDELARAENFIEHLKSQALPIVIIRHDDASAPHIQKFRRDFPLAIICNTAIAPFVNNKKATDSLFSLPHLRPYRPWSMVVAKDQALSSVKTILALCPAKHFVIKPLSSCKGNGVIFTARKNLKKSLQVVTAPHQRIPHSRSLNERYWEQDKNKELMIEACESSKPVVIDGKQFDGTLRIVFGLMAHQNTISAEIIGAYWKLPTDDLDSTAKLSDKKLSRIAPSSRDTLCSAPLSEQELKTASETFLPLMIEIYSRMLSRSDEFLSQPLNQAGFQS